MERDPETGLGPHMWTQVPKKKEKFFWPKENPQYFLTKNLWMKSIGKFNKEKGKKEMKG